MKPKNNSNNPPCGHLLQSKGILKNFSIRRKVSDDELKNLYARIRASCKTDQEAQKKMEKTFHVKNVEIIPGIIVPTNKKKRIKEIEEFSESLAEFIEGNNMTPKEIQRFLNLTAWIVAEGDPESFFKDCKNIDDDEDDEEDE